MPTIVQNCQRCGANRMTFDVLADVYVGREYGWQSHHEVAVQCRRCRRPSILKVCLEEIDRKHDFGADGALVRENGDLQPTFRPDGFLDVGDLADVQEPPADVPEDISGAFREGAKCMVIGCYNAAAAMFRLCLDLVTKPMLPDPNDRTVPQPNNQERFNLGPRIDWLIKQGYIASALSDLAHCVREDGNHGVHVGTLQRSEAEDILDFTVTLLERHFTEPARLDAAKARQAARRAKPATAA